MLLESVDGRPHLSQARPVFAAKKPVFIDKPVAGTLADAIAIYDLAKESGTPVFSSSSLRYSPGIAAMRTGNDKVGEVVGCAAYGPCELEEHHPDLYWYGIHGVETLFTIMGPGCESVSRVQTPGAELVAGVWKGGRIGTFRGLRQGAKGYGATVFGTKGIAPSGGYAGYEPLVVEICKFFKTGKPPVSGRGNDRDLRIHGSGRREQTPGWQAGRARNRDRQGQGRTRRAGRSDHRRMSFHASISNPRPALPAQRSGDCRPMTEDFEERPTRVRYGVLAFLAAMTFVLYLDRVCIGQAAPRIQEELGISNTRMGWVLSAFSALVCVVRNPDRAVGRPLWIARGPDANRRLVVVLHRDDGVRQRPGDAAACPVPLRRRRGRGAAEFGSGAPGLVPRRRTEAGRRGSSRRP